MSIASEITRLQGCKANIRTALVNKGITSASTHNMADFATDISNISAGGATITVTYNSSFYNKTMTCTKGSTTYTQTTTSSGSTVFNVTDEGTWTITCNGVSRTVYVTLNYSTQMMVTKTVTVYSAANDTVSFTDAVGSKTVTTNASGQGSVAISFIPPSLSITFTSSVAKNPSNLSQNYSKNITITESITSIKVMPDGALYWYGHISSISGGFNTDYTQTGGYKATVDYNTNSMTIHPASGYFQAVSTNNSISTSGKTIKAKIIWPTYQSWHDSLYAIGVGNVTNWNASTFDGSTRTSYNHTSGLMVVNCTANGYVRIITTTGFGDGTLDFLFYE